jgi:ribose transport system substrate-binding protein
MKSLMIGMVAAFAISLLASEAGAENSNSKTINADKAAASSFIAPYLDKPTPFPVVTPLAKSARGKKIAVMDCGTPICALLIQLMTPAAAITGIEIVRIQTGFGADKVAEGFDTVLAGNFDGVFVLGLPGPLWERSLAKLNAAKIPVIASGVADVDPSKVGMAEAGVVSSKKNAELLAAYVVARGNPSDVVFYETPELGFTTVMAKSFKDKLTQLCPQCSVRIATIPAATFGTSSPSVLVNDLQSHPSTKMAVFPVGEQALGLPSAMKTAGIEVDTISSSPDPQALKQIQDGKMTAGLGVDLPILVWTGIDTLARLMTGQRAEPAAVNDELVVQFLTAKDLKGDVSRGWSGYPDFVDRFKAVWANAK